MTNASSLFSSSRGEFPLPSSNNRKPENRRHNEEANGRHQSVFIGAGDHYYVEMPTSPTGALLCYNATGTQQWSKTPEQIQPLVGATGTFAGFYYDSVDDLLYTILGRPAVGPPTPLYLMSLNAAGGTSNIGSDVGTTNFTASAFGAVDSWGSTSFEGTSLYRTTEGTGDFIFLVGTNFTTGSQEYVSINSTTGAWATSNPAPLFPDREPEITGPYMPHYYNANGIGALCYTHATSLEGYLYIVNRLTGGWAQLKAKDVLFASQRTNSIWIDGQSFVPWGGYMVYLSDDNTTAYDASMYLKPGISQADYNAWLDEIAVWTGIA